MCGRFNLRTPMTVLAEQFLFDLGPVHIRMPVILDEADYDGWLAGEELPLIPFPLERMSARPVSTHINNARNEGQKCIEPRG